MKIMAELNPPDMNTTKEIPLEIIQFEILPRVPLKFLGRFMCVCKHWRSFLSTTHFARLLLHHQTHYKLLLLDSPRHSFCTLDCEAPTQGSTTSRLTPFEADLSDLLVLASLDGLVCVYMCETHELVLWNPLTDGYKKLANTNHHGFCNFDSNDVIGLYHDSSDDYRLLHVAPNGTVLEAYVYSWRQDSWRKIQYLENVQHLSTYRWSPATFFGESLYFIARDETIESRCHIVVFDVKSESFKELQFPHIPDGAVFFGSLVVVNDHIHLCVSYKITGNDQVRSWIDVWRMDTSWINVAAFSYVEAIPLALRPVYIMSDGNWLAIQTDGNHVYKIDWKNVASECVSFYGGDWVSSFQRVMYVETLVSPIL